MKLTTLAAATLCSLCALTAGVVSAQNRIDTQRPDAPELAAYGSYPIGVQTIELLHVDQLNIAAIDPKQPKPAQLPRYDRPLTVEIWYPAKTGARGDTALQVFLRDGRTEVTVHGKAMRSAPPAVGEFPLIIISHGYPGNRYLMSHLAENLASKGYVVASIDHTDSTYRTLAAFGSTLVNRPLDQLFVLEQMARLNREEGSFLHGKVDTSNTGLIGYSMGGYGAIITAGAGVSQTAIDSNLSSPHGTLALHKAGSKSHDVLPDERVKTVVVFGPWGKNFGVWDDQALLGVKAPMLLVAGSVDDVSGYKDGTRALWQGMQSTDRALLTFVNANHNAGAPMPAPAESFRFDERLGFNVSEHYTDPVWSSTRMNNISQHFVTAWMGKHLKSDGEMDAYLDLKVDANEGVWSMSEDGKPTSAHTYWKGFANRTAKALRYERLKQGE